MALVRINVIVPKKDLFDFNAWESQIRNTMRNKTEPDLIKIFEGTTNEWKTQPQFVAHHFKTNSSIGVQVYTRDSVYGLVNAGSPSHLIRPKNRGGFLRFQWGYISATKPGSLKSNRYIRAGRFIASPLVHHPGFKSRKFDEQIKEIYARTFEEDMIHTFAAGVP